MSHIRVKTKYGEPGDYGSTDVRTLYCDHNLSIDCTSFYEEDGELALMYFHDWTSEYGDKKEAMKRLEFPYKGEWGKDLKDGVEYWDGKF